MTTQNLRFIAKVSTLYYKEGYSQQQIAKQLHTSRSTVQRAIQYALHQGYVHINLDFPKNTGEYIELEKQLQEKVQIPEVIIAEEGKTEFEAAYYLSRSLSSHMTIGLTWGNTLKNIIDAFKSNDLHRDIKYADLTIIPLTGTSTPASADKDNLRLTYSSYLAMELAQILHAKTYPFPAPMYVLSKNVHDILLKEPEIRKMLDRGKNCDAAVFGIGLIEEHSSIASLESHVSISKLTAQGACGEIMGRTFDIDGNPVENEYSQRMIGISLQDLQNIDRKIAVVYGVNKTTAIKAACKGGFITTLITDAPTAKALRKDENEQLVRFRK